MAEAIFRIPSRTVQYGYVEIPFPLSAEGSADAETIAAIYVSYVYAFQKEEQEAVKRLQDEANETARQVIEHVLGGVTELPEDSEAELQEHLGGVMEIEESQSVVDPGEADDAPWNKPAAACKQKPWEGGAEAPTKPVLDEDW